MLCNITSDQVMIIDQNGTLTLLHCGYLGILVKFVKTSFVYLNVYICR